MTGAFDAKRLGSLTSILDKRQLSDLKLDQIKIKANILSAFTHSNVVQPSDPEVNAGAEAVNSETQRQKEEL